jgi:uncharacterized protein
MAFRFRPVPPAQAKLLPGLFLDRANVNRRYVMSLDSGALLQNHMLEAGLWQARLGETRRNRNYDPGQLGREEALHWGWESPSCQLRGHFLGHWLSAAAHLAAQGDAEARSKAEAIVAELARCQQANGGEWVASIPTGYLDRIARGQQIWAPHYTIHKTLMGLWDMHELAGSVQALDILVKTARWFHRWAAQFTREQMDEILDVETGGMLEIWAALYGVTHDKQHKDLVERYTRDRLFKPLLEGKDPLTNRHANTTIPEIHGAARAFDATGDERWRRIVEAYWKCAVSDRGIFATGSQTSGEIWTPPGRFAARLNDTNQEHCVVYNMIRLADWLYRWTGEVEYADYIERNLYNGVLAQQHPKTGMIAYFLPLEPGAHKVYGSPTRDFWCCHGTLVQAHTLHNRYTWYEDEAGLTVCQYVNGEARVARGDANVTVKQTMDSAGLRDETRRCYDIKKEGWHRPRAWRISLEITGDKPAEFELALRLPAWTSKPTLTVNGQPVALDGRTPGFARVSRKWHNDRLVLELPVSLQASPLPDQPGTVAVLDGPVLLAGLCPEERTLVGDPANPESFLEPDNEREWWRWLGGYRTAGQERGIRFVPLFEVTDEPYTIYFPVRKSR